MGQHTWFYRRTTDVSFETAYRRVHNLLKKEVKLLKKIILTSEMMAESLLDFEELLSRFEKGEIEKDEIYELYDQHIMNDTAYLKGIGWFKRLDTPHDLFRTNKREPDGEYTTDVLLSEEQCMQWISDPDNLVHFRNTIFDSPQQEEENKQYAIKELKKFWKKYPDGAIMFG